MNFLQWAGAWLLFFLLLAVFAKTAAGKVILYYLVWLALVLLLLLHAGDITNLFKAAGIVPTDATQGTGGKANATS